MDHTPHSRSRNMVQDYRRNHNILDHSTALKRSLRREQDPRQRHREPTSHHHASELRLGWARQPRQQLSWRQMPTLSVCCSCRTSFHCTCAQRKCFGASIGRAVHGDVYSVAKSEDRPERVNLGPDSAVLPFASYSMTSSARASSDGGTVMPSALAVLILTTISNLVGACTGRSAGFSPFKMRST